MKIYFRILTAAALVLITTLATECRIPDLFRLSPLLLFYPILFTSILLGIGLKCRERALAHNGNEERSPVPKPEHPALSEICDIKNLCHEVLGNFESLYGPRFRFY